LIARQAQNRTQVLLGGGEAKRPQADVVHARRRQLFDVGKRVGGAADNKIRPQQPAGRGRRHIRFAQVHAVGPDGANQRRVIVDDEHGPVAPADEQRIPRRLFPGFGRSVFYPKLYPANAAGAGRFGLRWGGNQALERANFHAGMEL